MNRQTTWRILVSALLVACVSNQVGLRAPSESGGCDNLSHARPFLPELDYAWPSFPIEAER